MSLFIIVAAVDGVKYSVMTMLVNTSSGNHRMCFTSRLAYGFGVASLVNRRITGAMWLTDSEGGTFSCLRWKASRDFDILHW